MSAKVSRRSFVIAFSVAALGVPSAAQAQSADPCDPLAGNPIVCENSRAGNPSTEWDINGAGDPSIQGFATDISVNKGETVRFKIATDASAYRLDIYRMGYYGGMGARKVATGSPSATLPQAQPACLEDPSTGLVDCGNWAESASWAVPADAVSGIYFAKAIRADTGGASHIVFVVRDDSGRSDLLFQTSDTTWQAYNSYGGNSLYTGLPAGRAFKVSYNRPFVTRHPWPEGSTPSWLFSAEYPMVRWLEANGYNVSYFTGVDTDRRGAEILEHKVFLSVGHDEYWSVGQRANVEAARDLGVNLAFFSGNEVFWKTRWEPSIDSAGTPHRTLVCYKETHANLKIDPTPAWTGTWRDPRFSPPADGGRPENALTGTLFMVNDGATSAITVPEPFGKLRFWRNTPVASLAPGETATLPFGTLGYEWDEDLDNRFRPAGPIRLSSTTLNVPTYLLDHGSTYGPGTATHNLTLYRAGSGALVFGAGTVQWSWGLDSEHDLGPSATDVAMQQATVNLLADMGAQPRTLQAGLVAAARSTDSVPPTSVITSPTPGSTAQAGSHVTVSGTATDVGGLVAAVEVSVDGGGTWHPATGRANWSYTWTPQSSGQVVLKSRAIDDSSNMEQVTTGTTIVVVGASLPRVCPCSIWNDNVVPAVASQADTEAVEVGVRFRSSNDGYITALRFYKGPANTGTHIGKLWTNTGTLLASVIFADESAQGWQQAKLPRAVAIRANTTYVASYHSDTGGYSVNQGYFATGGTDNAPLRALQDGEDGPNGVYLYGSGGFPTQTFGSTNYWVDVVFDTVRPEELVPPAPSPTVCPCSIWDDTATPAVATRDDFQPIELGLKFRSDTDGYITGFRFYKGPSNTGTHAGRLWTNTGTLLATAMFENESSTGWQQVNLPTPVAIRADTTYVVSYHTSVGGYSVDEGYFAGRQVDNSPLHALADGEDGPNGVYQYGSSGGFPIETFNATNYWVDVVFDTVVASLDTTRPTAPSTLTAAAVSSSQIDLTWSASSDDMLVAGYRVERCQGAGCANFAEVARTLGTSYSDAGLAAATSYSYRVRGADASANLSDYSNTATATTNVEPPPPDTTPPTAPSNLTAAAASSSQVDLNWTPATDNVGVTGYRVERCQGAGCSDFSEVASPTGTTYSDTGLAASTSYSYRVRATDAAGNLGPYSNTVSATTNAVPPPPTCPCRIWSDAATPAVASRDDAQPVEVGVRFRSAVDGYITGLRFYKGPANNGTHVGKLWTNTGTLLASVTFTGESASGWQQMNLPTPVAITASTTYVASYHTSVGGYAANDGYFAASGVDSPPLRALRDGEDGPNGVYEYGSGSFPMQTFNSTNYWVDVVFDTVAPPPDTTPPTAPAGLTATAASSSQIDLTWTASTDNVGVTGYRVERCEGAGCSNFAQVAGPAGTTYSDTGLAASTTYSYRVLATDAAGNPSPYSNTASATTQAAAPPPDTTPPTAPADLTATAASSGQIDLTWTVSTDNVGVTGYRVERCEGAGCSNFAQVAGPAGTTYSDTGLAASTTYSYRVLATDAAGNPSPYSNTASATTTAGQPSGLVAAYSFDAGSGTEAADASGNGNTGAISGASWTAQGKLGNALSFDGVDDWVTVNDSPSLDLTTGMTLEAWVLPMALGGWRTAVLKEQSGHLAYAMYAATDTGRPSGEVFTTSASDIRSPASLPLDVWTHLAVTYDGAVLALYVDGTQVGSRAVSGDIVTSAGALRIGGNAVWGEYFQGLIDEIRIYNRPLTAAEIQTDMNTPIR